ncbi:hypothetical protein BJX63DRAFT_431516 [Aspergillus granulosus]|uniref:Uncharacterized protein n=1 Tax=Aspergillus granulosus TaxID=176169 RepID=A0ABR4HF52_9EURO
MPAGSRRGLNRVKPPNPESDTSHADSSDILAVSPESEDSQSDNSTEWTPVLSLSLFYLRKHKLLSVADYRKLHTFKHPVPFVGIEKGRVGNIYTFDDAYRHLGHKNVFAHPGHPPVPVITPFGSNMDIDEEDTNGRAAEGSLTDVLSVQTISKNLYFMAPNFDKRAPLRGIVVSQAHVEPFYPEIRRCVSFLCQRFVEICGEVASALPLRVESAYDVPYKGAPSQWAILLEFKKGQRILLPLALSLQGQESDVGSDKNALYLQGWTIDHGFMLRPEGIESELRLKYYKELEKTVAMFQFAPVLHIKDVNMLFKRPKTGWRARRYASVWTLYLGPIHANYQSQDYYSPVIGDFSNVDALLKCIQERGSQVSFNDPIPEKPFELIRLHQILLEHQKHSEETCLVITQSLIDGLRPNSRKPLMAGDEAQAADISLKPTSKHNDSKVREQYITKKKHRHQYRAGLIHSLQAQRRFVDGKLKCELPSCPLAGQRPSSNFCVYHTETLLEHLETCESRRSRTEKWQLSSKRLDTDAQNDLHALKELYTKRPDRTWIIDFEFVTLGGGIWSPIPLQLAIRTIDGRLLFADNVEYNLNLEGLLARVASVGSVSQSLSSFVTRCYGGLRTNGQTPRNIRDIIIGKLKYDRSEINVLSWFSVQDMQCFQRIINAKDDELIVPKHSHLNCTNFQVIKLYMLLKGLLPPTWPSLQLGVVHTSLLRSQGKSPKQLDYHTAKYDTEAVADLIKEMNTTYKALPYFSLIFSLTNTSVIWPLHNIIIIYILPLDSVTENRSHTGSDEEISHSPHASLQYSQFTFGSPPQRSSSDSDSNPDSGLYIYHAFPHIPRNYSSGRWRLKWEFAFLYDCYDDRDEVVDN